MPELAPVPRPDFRDLVIAYGQDLPLDQALAVLAAEEQPDLDPAAPLHALDAIAKAVHLPGDIRMCELVARINHQIFVVEGFVGDVDTYDHPDNSLINRVIERRKGLPILLSALYIEIARRLGTDLAGVSFPAHFLVGTRDLQPRFFIDPFKRGAVLKDRDLRARLEVLAGSSEVEPETWARFTEPARNGTILVRVNHNLKRSYIHRGDLPGALRATERVLLLRPDDVVERRDRGMLLTRLGRWAEGQSDLEAYLAAEPEAWDANAIRHVLDGA